MQNRMRLALILIAGISLFAAAPDVAAQDFTFFGADEHLILSHTEEAAFNRVFSTSPEQRQALSSLLSAARTQVTERDRRSEAIGNAYRALPDDQRTPRARQEMISKLEANGPEDEDLRKQLLSDARGLLDASQLELWKKFEFYIRREKILMGSSGWYHDHTNLLALVESLELSPAERTPVAGLLDNYERDLDAALVDLETAESKLSAAIRAARTAGGDLGPDHDEASKRYGTARTALAQVN